MRWIGDQRYRPAIYPNGCVSPTADFNDNAPGNLRVDYVLRSKSLRVRDAGVFWPTTDDPLFPLVGTWPFPSSDHRLVWVDASHWRFRHR